MFECEGTGRYPEEKGRKFVNARCLLVRVTTAWVALLAGACAPGMQSTEHHVKPAGSVAVLPDFSVPLPRGLESNVVGLREGTAMVRGMTPLDEVVSALDRPRFLKEPSDVAGGTDADSSGDHASTFVVEPPLVAQRHYLAAREAWLRGLSYDAIRRLRSARRIAPNHPAILRFLARIYDEQGNADQSFHHFEKSARIESDDPYTLLMLARHSLDQGKTEDAIFTLNHLISIVGDSPVKKIGFIPLAHFYLGNALAREGYDLAAAEQWSIYLNNPVAFDHLGRRLREDAFLLHRGQGLVYRRLGDGYHRLGRPQEALEAYEEATDRGLKPQPSFVQRLVFTHLRLRQPQVAQELALAFLAQHNDEPEALALIEYLAGQGGAASELVSELHRQYLDRNRSPSILMAMVPFLPPNERVELLRSHIRVKPTDRVIFEYLIREQLRDGHDEEAMARALQTTANAVEVFERASEYYVSVLMQHAGDADALQAGLGRLSPDEAEQPIMCFLRGQILARAGRFEAASSAYRVALAQTPSMLMARQALTQLMVDHGEFEEALRILAPMDDDLPQIVSLRAKILAEMGRPEEARQLISQALADHPKDEDLILRKAEIDTWVGQVKAAELALLDLRRTKPKSTRVYEALIDLYLQKRPANWTLRYQQLRRHIERNIPHSRVARREAARDKLAQEGRRSETEDLLRGLLIEDPSDYRTLRLLLGLLLIADREDEAEQLLDEQLAVVSRRHEMQRIVEEFYSDLAFKRWREDRLMDVVGVVDRAMRHTTDDPTLLLEIQRRALKELGHFDEIELKLRNAAERFPDFEPELLLSWAMTLEQMERRDEAELVMIEVLQKFPDHAPTNNSLGYTWVDRNVRLDEAERMIERAVAMDPENPAYLDSLGWVYYKRGRFSDAVEKLSKAMMQPDGKDPVILDHLGDALYQLDRRAEAARYWQDALKAFTPEFQDRDADIKRLPERVKAKLKAVKANEEAPIAAIADRRTSGEGKTDQRDGPLADDPGSLPVLEDENSGP